MSKRKTRKLRPLAERKASCNSVYWRTKADEVFMPQFRGKPCEVCLSYGKTNTYETCGHHTVTKSTSAYFRHVEKNIVVVCKTHHKTSNDLAFHSTNLLAQNAALEWLKECRPDALECLETYKKFRYTKVDYERIYIELKGGE